MTNQPNPQQPIIQPQPQVQPIVSQPPVFNVPQQQAPEQPIQQPPEQPVQQQGASPEPEKKRSWKIWVIIAVVIIIAAGLGFYFLAS